jgi:hypothetical protein
VEPNLRRRSTRAAERIHGRFVALPHSVLESEQYVALSHSAARLLLLIAMQHAPGKNGCLVATPKYLRQYKWNSNDLTTRCIRELVTSGLIWRTRIGRRPNLAAWFAITWKGLEVTTGIDESPEDFPRFKPRRIVIPPRGIRAGHIAPRTGTGAGHSLPVQGAMSSEGAGSLIPSGGDYLEVAICKEEAEGVEPG